jgi:hypothetical protein
MCMLFHCPVFAFEVDSIVSNMAICLEVHLYSKAMSTGALAEGSDSSKSFGDQNLHFRDLPLSCLILILE